MTLKTEGNILSKRFGKVLGTVFEDNESTLEALKQLSKFYSENTLQARRDLRSKIEKRSLDINISLLSSFSNVINSFTSVYQEIVEMNNCVNEITSKIQNSKQQTKWLLQQTNMLQSKRNTVVINQQLSSSFLNTFQLSSGELLGLYGSNFSLAYTTFAVLDRIQQIHNNSKILIRSGLQTIALDTMEHMVIHQEEALERIYRWTQRNCRYIDNAELTDLIAIAMSKIQDRFPLFRYIMDEYCICRRGILVGAFIDALTKGGPSGKPAPIEMKAHNIQIYVTDMFAWLNKTISVEQQNLLALVKWCDKIDNDLVLEALIRICDGICQPVRMRIEKILKVPTQATVLYSVVNLLRYYRKCIGKVLPKGSVEETLSDLESLCEQVFLKTLQEEIHYVIIKVEAPSRDLSPTPIVSNLLALLRDLLSTANMSEGRENDMKKITVYITDPLLRSVNEQASRLPALEMLIYMLNCINDIQLCLSLFEYMDELLERLEAQADAQIDSLTSQQAGFLIAHLNIGPICTLLQDAQKEPLSAIPGMESHSLQKLIVNLEHLITSPELMLLPQFNLLTSSKYKDIVENRSREVLLAIYTQLYEAVNNPQNKYDSPQLLFTKTPHELKEDL